MTGLSYVYICVVPTEKGYSYRTKATDLATLKAGFGTILMSSRPFSIHSGIESRDAAKVAVKSHYSRAGLLLREGGTVEPIPESIGSKIGPLLDTIPLEIVEME